MNPLFVGYEPTGFDRPPQPRYLPLKICSPYSEHTENGSLNILCVEKIYLLSYFTIGQHCRHASGGGEPRRFVYTVPRLEPIIYEKSPHKKVETTLFSEQPVPLVLGVTLRRIPGSPEYCCTQIYFTLTLAKKLYLEGFRPCLLGSF